MNCFAAVILIFAVGIVPPYAQCEQVDHTSETLRDLNVLGLAKSVKAPKVSTQMKVPTGQNLMSRSSKSKVKSSKFKVKSSKFKAKSSKFRAKSSEYEPTFIQVTFSSTCECTDALEDAIVKVFAKELGAKKEAVIVLDCVPYCARRGLLRYHSSSRSLQAESVELAMRLDDLGELTPEDVTEILNAGKENTAAAVSQIIGTNVVLEEVQEASASLVISTRPSQFPSDLQSVLPTYVPSTVPSEITSAAPSYVPSAVPSDTPSVVSPSNAPSAVPSGIPSAVSSDIPSTAPSNVPSAVPSGIPSAVPSDIPSTAPSNVPSAVPSDTPSAVPSHIPSASVVPSNNPSKLIICDDTQARKKNMDAVTVAGSC